jgi:hypothetical protein
MSDQLEIILKGYFKYYNPTGEKIYLEVEERYINRLKSCMTQKNIKFSPFKEHREHNTIYIKNTKKFPVDVKSLEGHNVAIKCKVVYYEFKDKEGQLINGYRVEAIKAKLQ